MLHLSIRAAGLLVLALASPAFAATLTFDAPIVTGAVQAPGTWYTDRYAPAGFAAPVAFAGDNRLQQTISAADGSDFRPGGFSGAFYNTQGRKFDLEPATAALAIDLYVASDWATSGRRMAGLWGTAFDAGNSVSLFPIIEFTSDGGTPRFRGFDRGGWVDLGLPTGFAYDSFTRIGFRLQGGDFVYTAGDRSAAIGAGTSTSLGNVILQGHNTARGVNYAIYWDNLTAGVPEPASWAMLIIGFGGVGGAMRRRRRVIA